MGIGGDGGALPTAAESDSIGPTTGISGNACALPMVEDDVVALTAGCIGGDGGALPTAEGDRVGPTTGISGNACALPMAGDDVVALTAGHISGDRGALPMSEEDGAEPVTALDSMVTPALSGGGLLTADFLVARRSRAATSRFNSCVSKSEHVFP